MIGPSNKPFPSNIMLPAAGVSTHDDFNAEYVGGFIDGDTSREVFLPDGEAAPSPGLLTFNFESSAISNTNDGGYQGDRSVNGLAQEPC